jgi:antitoxin component YwqK of YwqJK toxin-antitoxin module
MVQGRVRSKDEYRQCKPDGVHATYDSNGQRDGVRIYIWGDSQVLVENYIHGILKSEGRWDPQCKPIGGHGAWNSDRQQDGIWTNIFTNGEFSKNTYVNGSLTGYSGYFQADGSPACHGNYTQSDDGLGHTIKDGIWTFYCSNGETINQTYVNGVEQGKIEGCKEYRQWLGNDNMATKCRP